MQNIDLLGLAEYLDKFGYTLAQLTSKYWCVLEEPGFKLEVCQIGPEHENFFAKCLVTLPDKSNSVSDLESWLDELEMLAFYKLDMIPILIGED